MLETCCNGKPIKALVETPGVAGEQLRKDNKELRETLDMLKSRSPRGAKREPSGTMFKITFM